MTPVRLRPVEADFPMPAEDRLGLATDALLVASTETESGQDFIALHTRPFAGEALNVYLSMCAPAGNRNTRRAYTQVIHEPLEVHGKGSYESDADREFIRRQAKLHHSVGGFGIGVAMRAFEQEVRQDWHDALEDHQTDAVYYSLLRTDIYRDISVAAQWQIDQWKSQTTVQPQWWGAEAIYELLQSIAPTERLSELFAPYGKNRAEYEAFGGSIRDYLGSLAPDVRDDVVGRAYSRLPGARTGSANHSHAQRLIVDSARQRHWIELPRSQNGGSLFVEPTVGFEDNGTIRISSEDGVSVRLRIHESADDTAPATWAVGDYTLPGNYYESGRYPAVAWHVSAEGDRVFYDQADTVRVAREAGLPVRGTPDSYLGKLLLKYFGQPGEYQPSEPEMKWLKEMGLPGSDSKRSITPRELPVWIQLPQHQPDLLNSAFIQASEAVVR